MRILVTGISGYVGAALAPRLEADGHEVRGMSRRGVSGVPGDRSGARGCAER